MLALSAHRYGIHLLVCNLHVRLYKSTIEHICLFLCLLSLESPRRKGALPPRPIWCCVGKAVLFCECCELAKTKVQQVNSVNFNSVKWGFFLQFLRLHEPFRPHCLPWCFWGAQCPKVVWGDVQFYSISLILDVVLSCIWCLNSVQFKVTYTVSQVVQ